jgi:hypothetical protein
VVNEPNSPQRGFRYHVSDEQLAAFARLTCLQRLEWLEAAREFSWLARTPETHARHERLRQGKSLEQ